MNHRTALMTAALALIGSSSLALGQLVPPPPETAPTPEKNIPVAPTQAPGIPMMPPPNTQMPPRKAKVAEPELPNVPYTSLVKMSDGKVQRLGEPAEYAALQVNPLLKPEETAKLGEYFAGRKTSFEIVLIDNLDLLEQVENGIFETIDVNDNKNFAKLLEVGKPLKAPAAPKPVWEDMRDKGMLTPVQAVFNRKISKEYYDALVAELKGSMRRNLAMSYKQYLDEPMYYHRLLLIEAAPGVDGHIAGLKLEAPVAAKVTPIVKEAKGAKTDDAKVAAVEKINKELSLEQRKALLRSVVAARSSGAKK